MLGMVARVLVVLSMAAVCEAVLRRRPVAAAPPLPWRVSRDVATAQGVARGYLGPGHFAFLGIPYASPPTSTDRFKAPDPPEDWDGIYEATRRVHCPQSLYSQGSENCLVVNVFVKQNLVQTVPVLVMLHDGGFHTGKAVLQPPTRFIDEFIIVTFNYRLGALGFLCLGIPEAPGNAGLKDQIAALYWVQENIKFFGGNPHDVTVYGIGAGAVSVQLLLLSGLTTGLMHKAILDSGSVLSPTSLSYNPYATALNVAKTLGYEDKNSTDELLDFYRKLQIKDLVGISTSFLPCVENSQLYAHSMIVQDPLETLSKSSFKKIPIMIVYTRSQESELVEKNPDKFTAVPEIFVDMLPSNLEFETEEIKYKIADLVKDFYFDDTDEKERILRNYKEYINDIFMEYPMYKLAVMYTAKTSVPVYVMRFGSEGQGGEYGQVLSYITAKDLATPGKVKIANQLTSLFTNFIKISDPTPIINELIPLIWEPLNPHGLTSVPIDHPCLLFHHSLTMGLSPSSQQINFWDYVYDKYYKKATFDAESL